jgi:acetylornithine deacetylase/succinyl-diaminopimelate desuccinylase-like protein
MRKFFLLIFFFFALNLFSPVLLFGQSNSVLQNVQDHALEDFQKYIQINTTNPPGNEIKAALFLKSLLDQAGIPNKIYESAPGRANLYAVLKGSDPSKGAFLMTNHMDVVPADPRYWKYPPFSAKIADGFVWGRGTMDMKGLGLAELEAMIAVKKTGIKLKRTVIFLAVCDEETGGKLGTEWMLEHHPELFQHIAGVINEEGPGILEHGKLRYWEVRPGQKSLVWLELIAHGKPGHASFPFPDTAPKRLIRALYRIIHYQTPIHVLPAAQLFFKQISKVEKGKYAKDLAHLSQAFQDHDFLTWFENHPIYNAFVRDTINVTELSGSNKTNVVPADAKAVLDCRLLPGSSIPAFIASLKKVVNDPSITFKILLKSNAPAPSPLNTKLFKAISIVVHKDYPGVPIVTPFSTAANDSAFFQKRGIVAYGFYPFVVPPELLETEHGNNERIPVSDINDGIKMLYQLILTFDKL